MEFTGERYIPGAVPPDLAPRIHLEHMHRYALAAELVHGRVLDIGSGAGYGTNLLANRAQQVVGLDVDPTAAHYGREKFAKREGLGFVAAEASSLPFGSGQFDWVVCFETIEHVLAGEAVVGEIARVLAEEGTLILSSPIGSEHQRTFPRHSNPFHVHEYEVDELTSLLARHFRHVEVLGQRLVFASWIWPLPGRFEGQMRAHSIPREDPFSVSGKPLYSLAICTNAHDAIRPPEQSLLGGRLESLLDGLIQAICTRYEAEIAARESAALAASASNMSEVANLRAELAAVRASRLWRLRSYWRRVKHFLGAQPGSDDCP